MILESHANNQHPNCHTDIGVASGGRAAPPEAASAKVDPLVPRKGRGRRYWTQTVVNGVWIRRPLCPPGSTRATTNWQEALRLEKELEHYSHIRLHAKKAALDRLDEAGKASRIKRSK
jgi:hypothetical protein